ncbi:MAG: replication restart helicase PriA, partial [Candidatus Methylomirabilales bacterium]
TAHTPEEREGRSTKIRPPTTHGAVPARSLPPTGAHLEPAAVPPRLPLWWDRLRVALDTTRHAAFLLQAPAAIRSACLFQAAEETLARHRAVLILVPEIARASGIAARAEARWRGRVHLLHSGLPRAARAELWRRIHAESAGVLVGTRSAVFAPLGSPGLIWVEDEEDPSLKEEEEPRYHAREVAWMRARQHDAVLVLGSAHPSLETRAAMEPLNLDVIGETAAGPAIQTVDLRRFPQGTLLSEPLIAGIGAALEARAGAVLFLNRKGFAPALLCRDCGISPRCRQCSVALTFYRRAARLACHYCGASFPLPDTCSACGGARIEPVGFGTERVEEEIRRLFRHARIGRLDRDIARTPAQAETIRRLAAVGELDILIGTQMLFQGLPLPHAGFVGIPHADAGLHLPDFRSAERTYHALLDAVALARPGDTGGKVVLQTYLPAHHAIAAVVNGNADLFLDQETAFRKTLGYPPFAHLINLRVSGKNLGRVREAAQQWAGLLTAAGSRERAAEGSPTGSKSATDDIIILGPIPSPVAQLRGRHRWQLLVKSGNAQAMRQAVRASLEELERESGRGRLKFEVDVDPVEMV